MAEPAPPVKAKAVPPVSPPGGTRVLGGVFGVVFAGIGLTVIGFLWSVRGFGEPPIFFKIFGTLVAVPFVAVGLTFFRSAVMGRALGGGSGPGAGGAASEGEAGYACPACGGRLGKEADVSPKGDVRCGYCQKWFNIHE